MAEPLRKYSKEVVGETSPSNFMDQWMDSPEEVRMGDAYNRWTKGPVAISKQKTNTPDFREVTGLLSKRALGPQRMSATATGNPNWKEMQHTLAHEAIHKVVGDNRGMIPIGDAVLPEPSQFEEMAGYPPHTQEKDIWDMSQRQGDPDREIPAYMSAYKPGELLGVKPEDAEEYVSRLIPKMTPKSANTLQRIRATHKAVQGQ